jgi:hypothetical protein
MRLTAILSVLLALSCRESEGTYQGYADVTASTGDSALSAVSTYLTLDSTANVRYDSAAARTLERLSTRFGGIMRPDTVAQFHRQMLEGLDSLVLAMRVLREREASCTAERTIDCADARDFGYICSMRNGASTRRRRRMRERWVPPRRFPRPPRSRQQLLPPGHRVSRSAVSRLPLPGDQGVRPRKTQPRALTLDPFLYSLFPTLAQFSHHELLHGA